LVTGDGEAPVLACDAVIDVVYRPAGAPFEASAAIQWASAAAASAVARRFVGPLSTLLPPGADVVVVNVGWVASMPPESAQVETLGQGSPTLRGHEIVAGSVDLSAATVSSSLDTGTGVAAVVLHELGHVLGLAHRPVGSDSAMTAVAVAARPPGWGQFDLSALATVGGGCGMKVPSPAALSAVSG
jgi:hypothetical protein